MDAAIRLFAQHQGNFKQLPRLEVVTKRKPASEFAPRILERKTKVERVLGKIVSYVNTFIEGVGVR